MRAARLVGRMLDLSLIASDPLLRAGLVAAAFAVAFVEVLPPLGRFIPGQLLVGVLGTLAWLGGGPLAWLVPAALLGALAGDWATFFRAWRNPRLAWGGRGSWWLPGHDVDRLEVALRRSFFRTYLLRRFLTRDRAILPIAAAAVDAPWQRFALASALASAVWAGVWIALGAGVALGAQMLPPAAAAAIGLTVLFLAVGPVEKAVPRRGSA